MTTEQQVALHPLVQQIAKSFTWEGEQLQMSDATRALWLPKLAMLKDASEKKLVLVSLVALATRFSREARGNTQQAREALVAMAAEVMGDAAKARTLF